MNSITSGANEATQEEEVAPAAIRLAAYAAPGIPISAMQIPLLAYVPTLYASEVGLGLGAIGTVFLLVRLADIIFDPLVGSLMDRGRGRYGRFRPWLAAASLPLALSVLALFLPPQGSGLLYLILALTGCYFGHSICYLAHLSWGATLAQGYNARSKVFAWWQAGFLVGAIVVLAMPIIVETVFKAPEYSVSSMGWLIAALLPITVAIALPALGEKAVASNHQEARMRDYIALLRQPTIFRLLAADFIIGTAIGINTVLFFFYFEMFKGQSTLAVTILLFVNLCGSLFGTPIWSYLTTRIGKHGAAAWAFGLYAISLIVIEMMPADPIIGSIVMFTAGLTLSAGPLLLRSMMADAGDEELLRTGSDRTGMISALFSGSNKLGLALAPGIAFGCLEWVNFNAAGSNGDQAMMMLRILYVGLPCALGLFTAWIVLGHKLTRDRHLEILAALARKGSV